MEEIDLKRLNQIEGEWEEIEASYRLAPYEVPINLLAERQKFLEAYRNGRSYEPQFDYLVPPAFPTRRIREFMTRLEPDVSIFEQIYYEKARNELLGIECVQDHTSRAISGLSCLMYGLPDKALVEEARRILSGPLIKDGFSEKGTVSAESAVVTIQSVLHGLGLDRWQAVVCEPMLAKMAVHRLDKEVRIRVGVVFNPKDIHRLVVHEIGVHVIRYENGSRQPIKLFANGFTGFLDTEEGLAVYEEHKAGLLESATLCKYAGRVVAAHFAANHSFSEVFCVLVPHLDEETAFDIVARAKRCFRDTSQPGAHTKDIVYLRGLLRVSAHLRQYPQDYELLFVGKIGLQHLSLVRWLLEKRLVAEPRLLPDDWLSRLTNDTMEVN